MKVAKARYLKFRLRIQKRDKDILHLIHRFRLVTIGQIHKILFSNQKRISCYRRVRMLESQGYLRRHGLTYGAQNFYLITLKGLLTIGKTDQALENKGQNQRVYNHQIPHDLGLVDIFCALSTLSDKITYKTENEIRAELERSHPYDKYLIPDALMMVKEPLKLNLAIELELNIQSPKRYEERFYLMTKDLKTVYDKYLYVFENINYRNFFIKQLIKNKQQLLLENILFVELDLLVNQPFDCPIYTGKGKSLTFRELFKRFNDAVAHTPLIPPLYGNKDDKEKNTTT